MREFVARGLAVAAVLVVPVFVGAQSATPTLLDPGTLPDSPFYFLKNLRENIQLFFTFDAERKAEQYLHLAEVRLAEYEKMVEKGKEDIAARTLEKYENQLSRALTKAEELKEKGGGVADELKSKAEEAAAKHREVLERNLGKVSESAKESIERALEASRKRLEKLDEVLNGAGEIVGGGDEAAFVEIRERGQEQSASTPPSDWKTYRNEKYGFEFRYPSGAVVVKSPTDLELSTVNYRYRIKVSNIYSFSRTLGTLFDDANNRLIKTEVTYDDYLGEIVVKNSARGLVQRQSDLIHKQVNGFDVFNVTLGGEVVGGALFIIPIYPKNIIITFERDDVPPQELDQILSTFQVR